MTADRNGVGLLAANPAIHRKAPPCRRVKVEAKGPPGCKCGLPHVTAGAGSTMSDFGLQNRGHCATRIVGTYCIYDGLPLTCHSLSKQFQHASLKANNPHTVSSAFPRTGQ